MIKNLIQFETYNRQEVHDIFDPASTFRSGTGTWGLQGIVKIPNREKDYIFFVTFGQSQSGHTFEEEITEDGILTWQSQPKQTLHHPQIIDFINHDHFINNIYLFLRTSRLNPLTRKAQPFSYLGRIAYVTHDTEREQPVYFKWQIIDWNLREAQASLKNMRLTKGNDFLEWETDALINQLRITEPPESRYRKQRGSTSREFRGRQVDFAETFKQNKNTGYNGEILVIECEKQNLIDSGRPDLAEQVVHTSVIEGDGAGFDILSFTPYGEPKFIEVKTTTGGKGTPFMMTLNEVAFSELHANQYYLYRLYNYNKRTNSGEFYILEGDISRQRELLATQFRVY
ncbi:hypothetical protein BMG_6129 (plasmid) [Priestia megaterium]|uniref:DUF3883 domain-containing protein n=1 Tax=Priestia megaterium TaxID=1404 RepID=UPI0015DC2FA4|nr:DUF3883 domain-containing protein [Priestia megaterium]QLK09356.1 hypothetical protein BMG_6129 [Priestia megaterium]